ncbi:MAG: hypothetical protein IJX79_02565 [Clostridia bacterium]|nr:hypothetical protein [Clostridia bacterium]
MKRILTFLLCFSLLFSLAACKTESDYTSTKQEKVSMTVKADTLTNTGVTLVIKNNTDEMGNYGYPFFLEKQEKGKWYLVNEKQAFILPSILLEPNSVAEHKAVFEGPLSKGKYRMIKSFYLDSGTVTTQIEFEIK